MFLQKTFTVIKWNENKRKIRYFVFKTNNWGRGLQGERSGFWNWHCRLGRSQSWNASCPYWPHEWILQLAYQPWNPRVHCGFVARHWGLCSFVGCHLRYTSQLSWERAKNSTNVRWSCPLILHQLRGLSRALLKMSLRAASLYPNPLHLHWTSRQTSSRNCPADGWSWGSRTGGCVGIGGWR